MPLLTAASGRRACLLAAGLCLVPLAAPAAQQVTLAPTVGVYVPTTSLVDVPEGPTYRQASAVAVGARLGVALSPRFGLETSLAHTPADRRFGGGALAGTEEGNLFFGTARATVQVLPATAGPVWLRVSGGASLVHRGGEARYYQSSGSDLGGVLGAALGIKLTERLSLQLSADDYIYRYQGRYHHPGTDQEYVVGGTQHDLLFAVGFGLPLGR